MNPAIRRIAIDALIAIVVAAVVAVAIRVADEPGARPPDARAYAIGAVIGLLLVFRRRCAAAGAGRSVTALMIYYALEYPGIPPALPLAAAGSSPSRPPAGSPGRSSSPGSSSSLS